MDVAADRERGAASERDGVAVARSRHVAVAHVDGNAQVGAEVLRGRARAEAHDPELLLHRRHRHHVPRRTLGSQQLERAQQHHDTRAVVHSRRRQAIPEKRDGGLTQGDHRSHRHLPPHLALPPPRIEVEILERDRSVGFALLLKMGRTGGEHRDHGRAGVDHDFLPGQRPRIESADLGDPEISAGLDGAHQESDLVHVRREKGARARRLSSTLDPAVHASHPVALDLVGDGAEGFHQLARDRVLLPGHAGKGGNVTQPVCRSSDGALDHSPVI